MIEKIKEIISEEFDNSFLFETKRMTIECFLNKIQTSVTRSFDRIEKDYSIDEYNEMLDKAFEEAIKESMDGFYGN
ncbi:MAG: hypothetical protein ACOC2W_00385 [bacterium]